jgi:hypothetical protein
MNQAIELLENRSEAREDIGEFVHATIDANPITREEQELEAIHTFQPLGTSNGTVTPIRL